MPQPEPVHHYISDHPTADTRHKRWCHAVKATLPGRCDCGYRMKQNRGEVVWHNSTRPVDISPTKR